MGRGGGYALFKMFLFPWKCLKSFLHKPLTVIVFILAPIPFIFKYLHPNFFSVSQVIRVIK